MIVGAIDAHDGDAGGATAALVVCSNPQLAAVTSERVTRIELDQAARLVATMAGPHRIPTALARGRDAPPTVR